MAADKPDSTIAILLTIGGFLVTGASNAFNQIIEKNLDKMMTRTENRPLPKDRLSVSEAVIFSSVIGVLGIGILWIYVNQLSGILGLVGMDCLYWGDEFTSNYSFCNTIHLAIPPFLGTRMDA